MEGPLLIVELIQQALCKGVMGAHLCLTLGVRRTAAPRTAESRARGWVREGSPLTKWESGGIILEKIWKLYMLNSLNRAFCGIFVR